MQALSSEGSINRGVLGVGLSPAELKAYAEIAAALAEVAEVSSLGEGLSAAVGVADVTPADLYQLFVKELPPFASIYLSSEGNIGGASRSVIAGFYSALGIPTPSDPDHLASLLRLLSGILVKEAELVGADSDSVDERRLASVSRARSVLVNDHLASWLPAYLLRAEEVAPRALMGWVTCAADLISVMVGECQYTGAATQVVEEDNLPPNSSSELISWITTPSRSGIIVTHWDIGNFAESLGLALRIGRKRFVLEELWGQAGPEVVGCIEALAVHQVKLFDKHSVDFPSLQAWSAKAVGTIQLLAARATA